MQNSLSTRSWNGTPIHRRVTDGYVNATAMCQANGKLWHDYFRTDRATEYLEALASKTGFPVFSTDGLVQSRQGAGGGTWIHPQVAVDLARWISAPFAVWMDGWFLETVQPSPAPAVALPSTDMLGMVERSISLMERLGGLDERDQILFQDIVRGTLLKASNGSIPLLSSADEELTISDAWLKVSGKALPTDKGQALGKVVAAIYRDEFKENPPKRTQFVGGAPRKVFSYKGSWLLDTITSIWKETTSNP